MILDVAPFVNRSKEANGDEIQTFIFYELSPGSLVTICYKLTQRLRVNCFIAGQYNTKYMVQLQILYTQLLVSFVEGLGEVSAHSFSFGIISSFHHVGTRYEGSVSLQYR